MITLENLKEDLGITGTAQDNRLNRLIDRATAMIQSYCHRYFFVDEEESGGTTDYVEEYKGSGTNYLNLKNYPIISLEKVEHNIGSTYDPEWEDITDYIHELPDAGQLFFEDGWYDQERNYRITYLGGYETIPADLQGACTDLVAFMYNQQAKQGLKSEKLGDYSYTKEEEANPIKATGVDIVLNKYRVPTC